MIFINYSAPEFELDPDQCLNLLCPLYGFCDAGDLDLSQTTLDKHHRNEMGMKPFRIDPSLYYLSTNKVLQGMSEADVDDRIRCGNTDFGEKSILTKKRF